MPVKPVSAFLSGVRPPGPGNCGWTAPKGPVVRPGGCRVHPSEVLRPLLLGLNPGTFRIGHSGRPAPLAPHQGDPHD